MANRGRNAIGLTQALDRSETAKAHLNDLVNRRKVEEANQQQQQQAQQQQQEAQREQRQNKIKERFKAKLREKQGLGSEDAGGDAST